MSIHDADYCYFVALSCDNVPVNAGPQAAIDIKAEFTKRPWHTNVECEWDGTSMVLFAESDHDPQGLALLDEFSDVISACISDGFDGQIRVLSVTNSESRAGLADASQSTDT